MFAGQQDIRAGSAFGVGEPAVLLDDQLSPQRNHEEDAQQAAQQRQQKDARVFQVEAEKDQRRQGEDDAGGDRLAGVAGGLDNIIFQDRSAAEGAQDADRKHGDGNGRPNRQARRAGRRIR